MTNYVNYQVELCEVNAPLIDQLNKLIIVGGSKKSTSTATDQVPTTSSKSSAHVSVTLDDVKTAAKAAKKDHGEDFAMQVLKDAGVEVGSSLGRSMGKIDEGQYAKIIATWKYGPKPVAEDDDGFGEDDGFGDDTPTVTADAVKTALKAYSKEVGRPEAKEIMTKNGAKALSNVDDCSAEQLAAMMKAMV